MKFLLQIRRGELVVSSSEKLRLLLQEQEESQTDKIINDLRGNLQEITQNPSPVPYDATDNWVWFLYEKCLENEILKY